MFLAGLAGVLWAGGSGPAALAAPPAAAAIVVEDGRLTITVVGRPAIDVVREIGARLGFRVVVKGRLPSGTISVRLHRVDVDAGVRRLLAGHSYVLGYEERSDGRPPRLVEIMIVPAGAGPSGAAAASGQPPAGAAAPWDDPPLLDALVHVALWGVAADERAAAVDATLYAAAGDDVPEGYALAVLVAALDDPDEGVRGRALDTLKDSGESVPVDRLDRIAREDVSPARRIQALALLAERAPDEAASPLRHALADPDRGVRERARELIADLHLDVDTGPTGLRRAAPPAPRIRGPRAR